MRFEGRKVVVTGGANGIGMAIAREFLSEGATVLVADRDRPALDSLPGRLEDPDGLELIETDLGEPGAAAALGSAAEERIGPVDVLVNNAGLMQQTPILEIGAEEWDRI